MQNGYVGIDKSKYTFFLLSSLIAITAMLITGFKKLFISKDSFFVKTHIYLFVFAFISVVSFLFSRYKNISLSGTKGWFMGLSTILIMCVVSYMISLLWKPNKYILYMAAVAVAIVYLFGLLDRFSIYLIPLKLRDPSYISTLGNINWFMGYYSVFTPIITGLFIITSPNKQKEKTAFMVLMILSFMTGIAQGSESIILLLFAMFFGGLFLCKKRIFSIEEYMISLMICGISIKVVGVMRELMPNAYNYETTGICAYLTSNNITFYFSVFILVLIIIYKITKLDKKDSIFINLLFSLFGMAAIAYLIIGYLKTNTMVLNGFNNSAFLFNESFASGRGKAYKIALSGIKEMNILRVLVGNGPDTFASYVYSISHIKNELFAYWPNDVLANAHSEPLTLLINEGIAGLTAFYLIFISFIKQSIKTKNAYVACIGLSVFSYMVHNLVSFMQLLNTPFIFILIGCAVAILKKEEAL